MSFDTKTLWMTLAISNLVFGLLMLVYAGAEGGRATLRGWASAQLLKGLAIVLIIIKPMFSHPWGFTGNVLYLVGHFVELAAFLAYAGLGDRIKGAALMSVALTLGYLVGIGIGAAGGAMAVIFSSSLFVLYGLSALALAASGRRRSPVQVLLVVSNGLIALTALARAGLAWSSEAWDPQSAALTNQAMFLLGYVFSLCDGFAFLLLVKEDADRSLLRMATTDELTGIANRAHFLDLAEDRRRLCLRSGQPITVMMMDLDHFKQVNDVFGHAVGDEVLRRVGAVLRDHLRDVDVYGRLGGEEFAVVLPGTSPEAALPVAERLRAALAETVVATDSGQARITVSLGLADLAGDRRLEQAMSEADQHLYRAKAQGRNRVVAATETISDRAGASLRPAL
ncbi:GAF domain/sensory box/EAL domain protein [Paramagnetospirillum magnetotacticum MS-1]|uniref:diguanylate cyclase n=1 Tax=Paramagnetospirillum magnetotacticum MS-1 TaxID=272627 RepID=A0A0C2YZZ5_PARME|nr:GGDEF domain-containing protein [Paramagnetospirillum magnetotacticum]KIM00659.1 GAF domain/sensory box/EAL domain protein [Paramagnetospirillum magnetotacticum MS-1]